MWLKMSFSYKKLALLIFKLTVVSSSKVLVKKFVNWLECK